MNNVDSFFFLFCQGKVEKMSCNECQICYDKMSDTILFPCKHNEVCIDCMFKIMMNQTHWRKQVSCPFCRGNVVGLKVKIPNKKWSYIDMKGVSILIIAIDIIYMVANEMKILCSYKCICNVLNTIVWTSLQQKDPQSETLYFQEVRDYIRLNYNQLVDITFYRPNLIPLIKTHVEQHIVKNRRLLNAHV